MAFTTAQLITQLYVGYYNRAPDPEGLNYWIGRVNAGVSLADIADSFAASPEALAAYPYLALPNVASAENFLNQVYQNLFNRAPDAGGLAYYAGKLASGATTPGQIIAEIQANANTNPNNTDGQILANKVTVASNWVDQAANTSNFKFDNAAKSSASSVLTNVDASDASVTAAIAKADNFFDNIVTGEIFEATVGVDSFVGTADNDQFKVIATNNVTGADATTWNSSDTFDGAAGRDTLNVEVNLGFNATLYSTTNIETININNTTATVAAAHTGGKVDASKFAGVEVVNQIGKAAAVTNLAATSTAGFKNIDTNATLSVSAADAAASVSVNLDGVKDSSDNVVALNVAGKALSSVVVSGAQVNAPVAAVKEVFTATFSAAVDADTITFDGVGPFTATAGNSDVQVAGAFASYYNAQAGKTWTALDNGDGTVTFTSIAAGARTDIVSGNFSVTGVGPGADVAVTVAVPTTQGVTAVPDQSLAFTATAGKNVETLSVNSAATTTLTVAQDGASTKNVTTVDASASTGAISYNAAATVAAVKTGSGKDNVTLAFAGTATLAAASVATGAGDDTITVNVTKGAATAVTATVDAGEGNDTIKLTIANGVTYDVKAGAGDDVVEITNTVKSTDKIDGGEGTDTVSLAGKANYVADDYIVFNKILTNFETLKLTGVASVDLDASKLAANYTTLDLSAGSTVIGVGTQALIANGALTATAAGYDATDPAAVVYAGTLNVTQKATGLITAKAETVNITADASKGIATATLAGDFKAASATLVQALKADGSAYEGAASVVFNNTAIKATTSFTVSGNGTATVDNVNTGKLVTIDASGLNSTTFDGKAATGLNYTSNNSLAETIKLGAGIDTVTLNGSSTYGATDTVEGLNLVLNAAGTAIDVALSDNLNVNGGGAYLKFTASTQTDFDLFLKDAAASADNNLVFHFGGDTYVYQDTGNIGLLDAGDTLVKLTGEINLDALILTLV